MIKKELIKQLIVSGQARLPFKNIVERELEIPTDTGKIITVSGVRRCGKSSLLMLAMNRLVAAGVGKERILFFNFDDERLSFDGETLDLILQAYRELYPEQELKDCYIFFDEIQMATDWQPFVRRVYEQVCPNIFITGSNSEMLSSELASALRGRSIQFEEFPLSFREMCRFKNIGTNYYNEEERARIVALFGEYLLWGGFPEIPSIHDDMRSRILNEYFYVMLYKDLVERYGINPPSAARYFIKRVMENITKPTSINKIYNELKSQGVSIGKDKVYALAEQTESIYLFQQLPRYSSSLVKASAGEKKMYCIDAGLRGQVLRPHSDDNGKMLENAVYLHLRRNLTLGESLSYFLEQKECDFVIDCRGEVEQLVQVCWSLESPDTLEREVSGLLTASQRTGCRNLWIITCDEERELHLGDETIQVMPAWKWML